MTSQHALIIKYLGHLHIIPLMPQKINEVLSGKKTGNSKWALNEDSITVTSYEVKILDSPQGAM